MVTAVRTMLHPTKTQVPRQQSSLVLTQHDEHYCHVALIAQAGGKKKAKEPAFDTAALSEFGLKVNEIVRTPLGVKVSVIGVKHDNPDNKKGTVWVRFANGQEAPLEGGSNAAALGFKRCTEADHIQQEVLRSEQELQKLEERRQVVQEVMQLLKEGQPVPEHLLPPPPKEEKKGKGKDDKDKKGKK